MFIKLNPKKPTTYLPTHTGKFMSILVKYKETYQGYNTILFNGVSQLKVQPQDQLVVDALDWHRHSYADDISNIKSVELFTATPGEPGEAYVKLKPYS